MNQLDITREIAQYLHNQTGRRTTALERRLILAPDEFKDITPYGLVEIGNTDYVDHTFINETNCFFLVVRLRAVGKTLNECYWLNQKMRTAIVQLPHDLAIGARIGGVEVLDGPHELEAQGDTAFAVFESFRIMIGITR